MGVGGQRYAPATLPPGMTRYPLYGWLGGPRARSERLRKISPPPGFDPRTVQPVASRYTDCAIPVQNNIAVAHDTLAASFPLAVTNILFLTILNAVQLCRTKRVNLHSGRLPV